MKSCGLKVMAVGLLLLVAMSAGCQPGDTRAGDERIRTPKVRTVAYYDRTLEPSAGPKEVVYVLLRAIRDDFLAETPAARESALDKQFDVCAAGILRASNRLSISDDEFVHDIVFHWTPTVSHYVQNFSFTWDEAKERLIEGAAQPVETEAGKVETASVLMELSDPSGEPNAQVVLIVKLARDGGYWRVFKLGFDPRKRAIGRPAAPPSSTVRPG